MILDDNVVPDTNIVIANNLASAKFSRYDMTHKWSSSTSSIFHKCHFDHHTDNAESTTSPSRVPLCQLIWCTCRRMVASELWTPEKSVTFFKKCLKAGAGPALHAPNTLAALQVVWVSPFQSTCGQWCSSLHSGTGTLNNVSYARGREIKY